MKCLIITDQLSECRPLINRLVQLDINVHTISDVQEGLADVESMNFNIAVLIFNTVPDSVGADIEYLRKKCAGIKIVVSTVFNTRSIEAQAREAGIYYYHIGQPEADELFTAIISALGFGRKLYQNNLLLHTW